MHRLIKHTVCCVDVPLTATARCVPIRAEWLSHSQRSTPMAAVVSTHVPHEEGYWIQVVDKPKQRGARRRKLPRRCSFLDPSTPPIGGPLSVAHRWSQRCCKPALRTAIRQHHAPRRPLPAALTDHWGSFTLASVQICGGRVVFNRLRFQTNPCLQLPLPLDLFPHRASLPKNVPKTERELWLVKTVARVWMRWAAGWSPLRLLAPTALIMRVQVYHHTRYAALNQNKMEREA